MPSVNHATPHNSFTFRRSRVSQKHWGMQVVQISLVKAVIESLPAPASIISPRENKSGSGGGGDATADFERQHSGEGQPASSLAAYLIGELGQPVS